MAIVFAADLSPTKPELVAQWVRRQPWCVDAEGEIELIGAFRFDDPDGEVGIETHLARGASGAVYQVPLTYRGAPLEGADEYLVTEMSHSVLGDRWVYDAVGDPVAVGQLLSAITTGATQVDVYVDGETVPLPVSVAVRGTGAPAEAPSSADARGASTTQVATAGGDLVVHRVVSGLHGAPARLDVVSGLDGVPATLAHLEAAVQA